MYRLMKHLCQRSPAGLPHYLQVPEPLAYAGVSTKPCWTSTLPP